jgi:hypothetical protein
MKCPSLLGGVGCIIVFANSAAHTKPIVAMADLDGDGKTERIVVDGAKSKQLVIYRNKVLLWSGVTRRVQPWKLFVEDLDGDGKREIIMGTIKATRFFPTPHPTLSVYRWDGKQAVGLWFGSSLARTFSDFVVLRRKGQRAANFVALETARDGKRSLGIYTWNGFGCDLVRQQGAWKQARLIGTYGEKVVLWADSQRVTINL